MQQTRFLYPLRTVTASNEPAFKLFIACEDNAAFFQARKVEDQVRALCGDEINVLRVFWSFSLLRHAQLRTHAAKEASEAQLIIISISRSDKLPSQVKALLENLPIRPQLGQAALVALIGLEEKLFVEPPPLLPYLRRIADSRGLDFFCNKSGWERLDCLKPVFQRTQTRVVAPGEIISYHIPWSTGGINE